MAESPVEKNEPLKPCSPIEVAVGMLSNGYAKRKGVNDTKAIHDWDTKYVQTIQSEMSNEGDTLIVIDVPQGHQHHNRSCSGASFPLSYRLRMDSEKLRASGFDLFKKLLDDDKYQSRQHVRRALKGEIIPPEINFILALGPASSEEDQATQLQILTLSKGVIRWHKTEFVQPFVAKEFVAGHDDCCDCGDKEQDTPSKIKGELSCIWDYSVDPKFRELLDYCEVRHASNVVRLLRRIAGLPGNLVLDSAPRTFTISGIAKMFEVRFCDETAWLRDCTMQWLFAEKNCEFIDILTEDAIVMGYNLMVPEIARTAFRLLASEHALQLESGTQAPPGGHLISVFGRQLRDVNDDEIQTAVEHAGREFSERVLKILEVLRSDDVLEELDIPAWRLVCSHVEQSSPEHGLAKLLQDVRSLLVDFIQRTINRFLMGTGSAMINTDFYDKSRRHFVPQSRFICFVTVWRSLNEKQKALTSVFWRNMGEKWPNRDEFMTNAYVMNKGMTGACKLLSDALKESGYAVGGSSSDEDEPFKIGVIARQLRDAINDNVCKPLYDPDCVEAHGAPSNRAISSHMLVGLNENEMRFMPLWAGGLNDGSGGVYVDDAPPSDMGPSGPGPSYHTGYTVATDSCAASAAGEGRTDYAPSTTVGSMGLDGLGVQSISSVGSLGLANLDVMTATDAARVGGDRSTAPPESASRGDDDDDFAEARFAIPAEHQDVGQAVAQLLEDHDTGGSSTRSYRHGYDGYHDDDEFAPYSDDALSDMSATPTPSVVAAPSTCGQREQDHPMSDDGLSDDSFENID